ncbi:NAD(P)-dependent oxidoreductase [Paraburkholderia ferrariae]|uniref:NAD(P)-dependent oxidoreductase n=1 Tax=Paraburkholderia ferrariae TaxID=386056 RepID=A0ABU9RME3_9BURK
MTNVGVIGLGNMGRGMAASLLRRDFKVIGYDASPNSAALAREAGVELVASLAAVAAMCETLVLSLPNPHIVETVINGVDGLSKHMRAGTLIIDTSTSDPDVSRRLAAQLNGSGVRFVDAPVSGGPRGAQNGELTFFLGGAADDVDKAGPVLDALAKNRFHIGASGAGNVAKVVNNLLCASHLVIAAEAFKMAEAAGVTVEDLLEPINAGSGRSGVTLYNYPSRIMNGAFNSGFTMQLMRKDVRLAMAVVKSKGLDLPVCQNIADVWQASEAVLADGEDFNRIVQFVSSDARQPSAQLAES